MSGTVDPLDRLEGLLRDGVIDQREYDREVAKLGQLDVTPPGSATKRRVVIAVVVALLVALTYLIASVDPVGDDATVVPQTAAENIVNANNAPIAATVQEPAADYQALCIYSGLTPLGTRLSTMANLLSQQGRTIAWEAAGKDWIMRTSWHDQLTGTDHEEAFEFQRRDGASPAPACNRPIGEVQLNRVARDGIEIAEPDPSFASLLHQDIEQDGTTAEAVPSADTLRSGRCKLVVKGQSYIDGPCFYSLDDEGSFSIYDTPEGTGGYFATLVRDGASGVGYWNGSKGSTHAQDELGTMSRNGACWSNEDHRMCLWG